MPNEIRDWTGKGMNNPSNDNILDLQSMLRLWWNMDVWKSQRILKSWVYTRYCEVVSIEKYWISIFESIFLLCIHQNSIGLFIPNLLNKREIKASPAKVSHLNDIQSVCKSATGGKSYGEHFSRFARTNVKRAKHERRIISDCLSVV